MSIGWLYIISLFYLALVVSLVISINESDRLRVIFRRTLWRWVRLVGALFLIGLVVYLLTEKAEERLMGAPSEPAVEENQLE